MTVAFHKSSNNFYPCGCVEHVYDDGDLTRIELTRENSVERHVVISSFYKENTLHSDPPTLNSFWAAVSVFFSFFIGNVENLTMGIIQKR